MPIIYALLGFAFFGAVWCSIIALLGRLGGWSVIASRYACSAWPAGTDFHMQAAQFNWVDYNGCLTIRICPDGLGISIWPPFRIRHPKLLIPWSALHVTEVHERWYGRYVKMHVDDPPIARIRLPLKVMEAARQISGKAIPATDISTDPPT